MWRSVKPSARSRFLDQDHDSLGLALERTVERFGGYLHFDGNQAGARILVDIVVTHDLAVTLTDDQLNAQIQLRRTQNGLDRGRSIVTSDPAQTPAEKRGADASELTPEREAAVEPDGQVASQQTDEVFVDCGAAPFNFDEKNDLNYLKLFCADDHALGRAAHLLGKRFPARALEEAGAKVGECITATRVASKPVTVEEIQAQPQKLKTAQLSGEPESAKDLAKKIRLAYPLPVIARVSVRCCE